MRPRLSVPTLEWQRSMWLGCAVQQTPLWPCQTHHDLLQGGAGAERVPERLAGLGQLEPVGRQVLPAGLHAYWLVSSLASSAEACHMHVTGRCRCSVACVLGIAEASVHAQLRMCRCMSCLYLSQPAAGPHQRVCNWHGVPQQRRLEQLCPGVDMCAAIRPPTQQHSKHRL